MSINGDPVRFRLDPETPLIFALRDAANLTGAKYGCGDGSCHACTVIVDGQAVRSCQLKLRDLEGAAVTTIEGLSAGGQHPVQQAWSAQSVSLCGFCEPGMIMAMVALLATNGRPEPKDFAELPNACPCGGGPGFIRAGLAAAQAMQAAEGPLEREAAGETPENGTNPAETTG